MDGYEGASSPRYGFGDPISTVTFEAPELPEETLMEVNTNYCIYFINPFKQGHLKIQFVKWSGI